MCSEDKPGVLDYSKQYGHEVHAAYQRMGTKLRTTVSATKA